MKLKNNSDKLEHIFNLNTSTIYSDITIPAHSYIEIEVANINDYAYAVSTQLSGGDSVTITYNKFSNNGKLSTWNNTPGEWEIFVARNYLRVHNLNDTDTTTNITIHTNEYFELSQETKIGYTKDIKE